MIQTSGVEAMTRMDNREMLSQCFQRFCHEFGEASGQKIIKVIIEELGGLRVTIPDVKVLCREERDRKIRAYFNGVNHKEIAIRYQISESQVRRILNDK